ncbi:MAG TPA: histidine kinase dimerization/phospho-acceptor domain-containing protein [Terriglobales bacterium]|nr:histidine kinase dimerization/phospho-acceptor domain-containing protein [Terriglobales bacterium]
MDNVLIIADDADFTRSLVGRWQMERAVPTFTQVTSELWTPSVQAGYPLTVIGPIAPARLDSILSSLEAYHALGICVTDDGSRVQGIRTAHPRILVFRQYDGWVDTLVLLAAEMLKRVDVLSQLRRAEQAAASDHRHATLGRYILEMRHSFNNALTSVLGNAELLLLEPGAVSAQVREQIDTIHSMALRMHEIMQRLSSLEAEMNCTEKFSQNETSPSSQAYAIRF